MLRQIKSLSPTRKALILFPSRGPNKTTIRLRFAGKLYAPSAMRFRNSMGARRNSGSRACVHASNRAQDIHDHVTVLPVVLAFCRLCSPFTHRRTLAGPRRAPMEAFGQWPTCTLRPCSHPREA